MTYSDKLLLNEVDVKGQRVLIRVDFNVPMKDGKITNTNRIDCTLPTIEYCIKNGAKAIILMSHLGRPQGNKVPEMSMKPVAVCLSEKLHHEVKFLDDCQSKETILACKNPSEGSIFLLENLRFYAEEEGSGVKDGKKFKPSEEDIKLFRERLSELGDIYINDAFGTAHRAHSSMVGVNLPIRASGFLMGKELHFFGMALEKPQHPFTAIVGGSKVSDKIQLLKNLIDKVDNLLIGGGMAFTFLKVLNNMKIGSSLYDEEGSKIVKEIMDKAKAKNVKILLPNDFIIGDKLDESSKVEEATIKSGIKDGYLGLDIGKESLKEFGKVIKESKTIIWNGPVGVFEVSHFSKGSKGILEFVGESTKNGGITIVGGGDTATCVQKNNGDKLVSHISTGGGASLELLEGKILPGITALSGKNESKSCIIM